MRRPRQGALSKGPYVRCPRQAPHARLRRVASFGAATALLVAACGGGGQGASVSPTSSSRAATSATTSSSAETPPTQPTDNSTSVGSTPTVPPPNLPTSVAEPARRTTNITLPAGGPTGPVFPPNDPAYLLLTSGRCSELLQRAESWERLEEGFEVPSDQLLLYRSAAHACLGDLAAADADFTRLQSLAPSYGEDCPAADSDGCELCHRLTLAWLTQVIEAYSRDPALTPVFTTSAAPDPCPGATSPSTTTPEPASMSPTTPPGAGTEAPGASASRLG